MEEHHLSLTEAAGQLDISERTARRWIKSGKLRAYKPGRDYRIPESAIHQVMEESVVHPKAESRSSLEPSLLNGLEEERHLSLLADAITAASEAWLTALSNPNISIQKRFGIRDAAIELFEQINARVVGGQWEALSTETRREFVRAMAALNEVPEESYRLMPAETLKDSDDVRREERKRKIWEWTRRISA